MKIVKIIMAFFTLTIGMAQVGIGIETPEADLDVNVKMKASGLPDVSNKLDDFNRIIYANAEGDLGYRTRMTDSFIYRNSHFVKMKNFVIIHIKNTPVDLGITLSVLVPPMKKSLIELNYSVAVLNGAGNASILLSRVRNQSEVFLYDASRSFSFSDNYGREAGAKGRAISNLYYDEVENNSQNVQIVTYKVYGMVTRLHGGPGQKLNYFGMWSSEADVNTPNYNWGRGSLNINVFDYE